MMPALRHFLLLTAFVISPQLVWAQRPKEITIVEPGVIKLASLFNSAHPVALVKAVSGDTGNYASAGDKGKVLRGFKGAAVGDTVYFALYVGMRLGSKYILFLRSVAEPIAPKTTSKVNYGTVHYSEVFNEGYSSMETSNECVSDGKAIAEHCDFAVRF